MSVNIVFFASDFRKYREPLFNYLNENYSINVFFNSPIPKEQSPGLSFSFDTGRGYLKDSRFPVIKDSVSHLLEMRTKSDVVILAPAFSDKSFVLLILSKVLRKKVILWVESWHLSSRGLKNRLKNSLMKFQTRMADALIVHGKASYEFCRNLKVPSDKIFVAPHCSLDYSNFKTIFSKKDLQLEENKVILFLGRIIRLKGLDYLIRAFGEIEKTNNSVFLLVAGTGDHELSCKDLAEELTIKNIRFLGEITEEMEVASLYSLCDVLVLPSFFHTSYEGWGLVINEAMSMGKPIITTDAVGAAQDLVKDGVNGYVVSNGSVDVLVEAMHKVLSDDTLRKTMGKNSLDIFEYYNNFENMCLGFRNAIDYATENSR